MSALSDLVNSNQTWAADRAKMAIEIQEGVKSGDLSSDEAKELLENLIEAEQLESDSTDVQLRAAMVKAISEMVSMMATTI
jgi:polyhydroxyalkanoate synthesis regulator phasin